jgi:hypothetical protein
MTLAAIDRLVHHATILEINVESYRRRAALDRKRGPGRPIFVIFGWVVSPAENGAARPRAFRRLRSLHPPFRRSSLQVAFWHRTPGSLIHGPGPSCEPASICHPRR